MLCGVAAAVYVMVVLLATTGLLNPYWQRVLDQALIMCIGALGLNLIYGFTGQFSIGHSAWYGIGAYTAGLVSILLPIGEVPAFLVALAAGTIAAALVAFLVGLPVLRLKSDYLGIATLGFCIIVKVALDNSNRLIPELGGATGMTGVPQVATFTWIYAFAFLAILICRNFVFSGVGRACMAIREDDIAADTVGINTTKYKLIAFTLGCALAGLAGSLYAHRYPFLHPSTFDFLASFDFLIIVVLGGLGSLTGTIVTALGWAFILEGLRVVLGSSFVDWRGVIYAVILIVVILLRRQGLFGGREAGLLVPSFYKGGKHAAAGS